MHLGALSGGRFMIAMNCSVTAFAALSIAVRYCCVRRQFSPNSNNSNNNNLK